MTNPELRSLHHLVRGRRTYWRELAGMVRREGVYPLSYLVLPIGFAVALGGMNPVLVGLALMVIGGALFLPSQWLNGRNLRRNLVLQSGYAVLATFLMPSAVWLHLLPIVASARQVRRRSVVIALLVLTAIATLNWWIIQDASSDPYKLLLMPGLGGLFGLTRRIEVSRERVNARLKLAEADSIRLGASAERERIARDLHDLLGHSLSLIAVKAELTKRVARTDLEHALEENEDVVRIAKNTLSEVRQAVTRYRAPTLEEELANAELALRAVGVVIEVSLQPVELTDDQEEALAFALREAVTNVVRHAEASSCKVDLRVSIADVVLRVSDNGKGRLVVEGAGLRGIRSRAEALGGTMERMVDRGSCLIVRLPLVAARRGSQAVT